MRPAWRSCQTTPHAACGHRWGYAGGWLLDLPVHPAPPGAPSLVKNYPMSDLWRRCLERLESVLCAVELHTWLMPLQAREDEAGVHLFAPNPYTLDTVRERYLPRIEVVLGQLAARDCPVRLDVGSSSPRPARPTASPKTAAVEAAAPAPAFAHNLDPHYT